jgi:hypothetical protein
VGFNSVSEGRHATYAHGCTPLRDDFATDRPTDRARGQGQGVRASVQSDALVVELRDDTQPTAERLDVGLEGSQLGVGERAMFDLADACLADLHALGESLLVQRMRFADVSQPLSLYGVGQPLLACVTRSSSTRPPLTASARTSFQFLVMSDLLCAFAVQPLLETSLGNRDVRAVPVLPATRLVAGN